MNLLHNSISVFLAKLKDSTLSKTDNNIYVLTKINSWANPFIYRFVLGKKSAKIDAKKAAPEMIMIGIKS